MEYKLCKFCENSARDTPLCDVYIPHFDQISVKNSVLGVKFGMEVGGSAKFHRHRCNVSILRGEKPQNQPLSNLNNRRFALRAMMLVKK